MNNIIKNEMTKLFFSQILIKIIKTIKLNSKKLKTIKLNSKIKRKNKIKIKIVYLRNLYKSWNTRSPTP